MKIDGRGSLVSLSPGSQGKERLRCSPRLQFVFSWNGDNYVMSTELCVAEIDISAPGGANQRNSCV